MRTLIFRGKWDAGCGTSAGATLVFAFAALVFAAPSASAQALTGGASLAPEARAVLLELLRESGNPSARVTSLERTPRRQAELMRIMIRRDGLAAARALYGSRGDSVIAVYERHARASKSATLAAMTREVERQTADPDRTELMHVANRARWAVDVAPSSLRDPDAFAEALAEHPGVVRYYVPGGAERAFHIEVPKAGER